MFAFSVVLNEFRTSKVVSIILSHPLIEVNVLVCTVALEPVVPSGKVYVSPWQIMALSVKLYELVTRSVVR
jgi:hypothetical protein